MGQIANKMLFDAVTSLAERIKSKKAADVATERLTIRVMTDSEMEKLIAEESDAELKKAYGEMLSLSKENPKQRKWYAAWQILLCDGTRIGDLCFKGLKKDGAVEIGYGLLPKYFGNGYATEAVQAVSDWALSQKGVTRIEAEAEEDNAASQRVLEKTGFVKTGELGSEGIRFAKSCKR